MAIISEWEEPEYPLECRQVFSLIDMIEAQNAGNISDLEITFNADGSMFAQYRSSMPVRYVRYQGVLVK